LEQEYNHSTITATSPEPIAAPLSENRRSGFGRIVLILLAALSIAGGLWMGTTEAGRDFAETVPGAARTLFTLKKDPDLLFDNVRSNRVNILLVGEDYNWTIKPVFNPRTGKSAPFQVVDKEAPPRSDTMIVFTFDRDKRTARMISLPRDARVTYTDLDGDTHHNRKLNAVYASGGKDPQQRQLLLKRFLREEFGLRIDRVAVIKPNSFKKLVNMAGGVYLKVDGALEINRRTGKRTRGPIHYKDSWGQWEVKLNPGSQWLNGEQAHGYVRFRKDAEGDPGRIRRQQAVMKALAKRLMEKPFWQIPSLVKDVRREFLTDMSDDELGSAALFAKNLGSAEQIQPLTLFGRYASDGDIVLNRPKNQKLLAHLFGDSFSEDSFLRESSWTRRDDIGPANNASPGVKTLLKEAGIE
jgi:LCP family protein required for cell wall assembly